MKIKNLVSTDTEVIVGSVVCRLWHGETDGGIPVQVVVQSIRPAEDQIDDLVAEAAGTLVRSHAHLDQFAYADG
jgi:hypothetical protein